MSLQSETQWTTYLYILFSKMLSKISWAWQWTVCRRVGLFSRDQTLESPLASFEENKATPSPPEVGAHDVWIKFLAQRFEIAKYYSSDQVSLPYTCIHLSIFCQVKFTCDVENKTENIS